MDDHSFLSDYDLDRCVDGLADQGLFTNRIVRPVSAVEID
jgi:hypothetical protein